MFISLPYGSRELNLQMPGSSVLKIIEPKPLPSVQSEDRLVNDALTKPVDSAPLKEIVKKGDSACIIVGDMTRLWARHDDILPAILAELNKGGITDEQILIISATGDHRAQTDTEHIQIVGEKTASRIRIIDHRSRDEDNLAYMGKTSFGTPVRINKRAATADHLILTGSIVYHFLAGWGGGKKAVLPGIAGYETIMKNHSLAFNPDPGSGLNSLVCAGKTSGNPCSEDMLEGAQMAKPSFLVNTIVDEKTHRAAYVVAGNYISAHDYGCNLVNEHYGVNLTEKADLIIASCGGYPKDINLYQTYKTIYNAHFALKKGGTLVLLSESREGWGNDDFSSMIKNYTNNREREAALRKNFTIGGYMGYHTTLLAEEYNILLITAMAEHQIKTAGMNIIATLEEGLQCVRNRHGEIPPAYIMPYGGSNLPFIG